MAYGCSRHRDRGSAVCPVTVYQDMPARFRLRSDPTSCRDRTHGQRKSERPSVSITPSYTSATAIALASVGSSKLCPSR